MQKPEATDAIERLYAAPLEEFLPLRRALATALRASDPAAARLVAGAGKPTRTAWALNQVARRDAGLLTALFQARDEAANAQKRGEAARMLEGSRRYRDAVNAVVHAARAALSSAGVPVSAAQARRMAETLQAMAAEPGPHRAQLLAGRLVRDVPVEDPFAGLEAGPPGPRRATPPIAQAERATERAAESRTRGAQANAQRRRAEEEARARRKAQAELEAARRRVAALEEDARAARAEARQAENDAARAQAAAERARAKASDVEERLRRAKEALRSSS